MYLDSQLIDHLLKLKGRPSISFPWDGDTNFPKIERIVNLPKGTWTKTPNSTTWDVAPFADAQLTDQRETGGDDTYVEVYQMFEVLPGKVRLEQAYDEESGATITTARQRVAPGTTRPARGSALTIDMVSYGYVMDAQLQSLEVAAMELVVIAMPIPDPRQEAESVPFQFPALFVFIAGWAFPVPFPVPYYPPYPGVNFILTAHRNARKAGITTISYALTEQGCPDTWEVVTPGAAARIFQIAPNTIHNPIFMEYVGSVTQVLENMPASTPSSYSPGDTLTVRASEKKWRGIFYELRVTTVSEEPFDASSPVVTVITPTTGFTEAFNSSGESETMLLTPAGTLATGTVVFPIDADSVIGQVLSLTSTEAVTALTISASGLTINGTAVTALVANVPVAWKKTAAATWTRIE